MNDAENRSQQHTRARTWYLRIREPIPISGQPVRLAMSNYQGTCWMISPRYAGLLLGILAAGWLGAHRPSNAAPVEARTSTEAAAMFKPDAPGWVARDRGYGGPASGNWSSALAGEASWSNYALDCRLALVRPADRRDGMELGAFVAFANHAQLGGYEAGLILRYQSPTKFYRVAVSSLWKEVIVWRPSGGVVQAVDFPFEAGKTYHLIAQCRGPRIVVEVDGKPLIDWWDTADPIESGKAGLARKEGESYFAAVKIDPLEAPAGKAPVHAPAPIPKGNRPPRAILAWW